MTGVELLEMLNSAFAERQTAGSLVMVREKQSGVMFSIKDVVVEHHEDADSSTTHWIEVEEY